MKSQNEIRELLENSLSGIDRCKIESLTKAILNLMPFQKLERVRESIQRFNESCDKAPNFVLAHNQIRKILNCELDNILSENEKAEG